MNCFQIIGTLGSVEFVFCYLRDRKEMVGTIQYVGTCVWLPRDSKEEEKSGLRTKDFKTKLCKLWVEGFKMLTIINRKKA